MYAKALTQPNFADFLAMHGMDGVRQIVDSYDTLIASGRSHLQAVNLLKENKPENPNPLSALSISNFDDKLLNDIFDYANSKIGRISGNIKDNPFKNAHTDGQIVLENEVRKEYARASVTPISSARNYGANQHRYEEPAKDVPFARPTQKRSTSSFRRLGKYALASGIAAYLTLNPFSGLFGRTYVEDARAQTAPTGVYQPKSADYYKNIAEQLKEAEAKKGAVQPQAPPVVAGPQAPPADPAKAPAPPVPAAPAAPATAAAPKALTLQDLQARLDILSQNYSTLNQNYTTFREGLASLKKDYETHKASLGPAADGFGTKLTDLEAQVAKLTGQAVAPTAPTAAATKTREELAALHATYKPGWQQRGPWHGPFMKGETKYQDLPPEGQKWFGLQKAITSVQERQDDCIVTIKIPHSYKGADLPQQYMGVKLPGKGWVFALPPNEKTDLTFSKQECQTLKASYKPALQWGMYTPKDDKKERFWVSSVNLEKKKPKPVVELPPRAEKKVEVERVVTAPAVAPAAVSPAVTEDVGGIPYETKHRTN